MDNNLPSLIAQIANLQEANGLFPSFRKNKFWFYRRKDENVFYAANIVFLLKELKSQVSHNLQAKIDEIAQKVLTNYPDFENKDGLKTYNFWKTKPSKHFPDGYLFQHFDHFRIPDDIDDTALVYLTSNVLKEQVLWLKEKLKLHANTPPRFIPNLSEQNTPPQTRRGINNPTPIQNIFPHYRHLQVYSTWFGKNMPIEFDVCALCNLMYLILKHDLPLNQHDEDTFSFLASVIEKDEFINFPFQVAHNYGTTPIIIYHYARLMGNFKISILEKQRSKIIETAKKCLEKEKDTLNQIILETALMRLDDNYHPRISHLTSHISNFHYFFAGLLSAYENPVARFFAPFRFFHIAWECEAHNLCLIAENLALRKKNTTFG